MENSSPTTITPSIAPWGGGEGGREGKEGGRRREREGGREKVGGEGERGRREGKDRGEGERGRKEGLRGDRIGSCITLFKRKFSHGHYTLHTQKPLYNTPIGPKAIYNVQSHSLTQTHLLQHNQLYMT